MQLILEWGVVADIVGIFFCKLAFGCWVVNIFRCGPSAIRVKVGKQGRMQDFRKGVLFSQSSVSWIIISNFLARIPMKVKYLQCMPKQRVQTTLQNPLWIHPWGILSGSSAWPYSSPADHVLCPIVSFAIE
jgi:hypothetical protein